MKYNRHFHAKSGQKQLKSLLEAENILFACLNDNIDRSSTSDQLITTDIKDFFYERKFPTMSNFEIGNQSRNITHLDMTCVENTNWTIYWVVFAVTATALLMLNFYRRRLNISSHYPVRFLKNKAYTRLW